MAGSRTDDAEGALWFAVCVGSCMWGAGLTAAALRRFLKEGGPQSPDKGEAR